MRVRLREGVKVTLDAGVLGAAHEDEDRDDSVEVASIDGKPILWADVKDLLQTQSKRTTQAEFHLFEEDERSKALNQYIDSLIMARKGREAGLERDPTYQRRYNEYAKNHLTNMHRDRLYREWAPSDDELWEYFNKNRDKITLPESRQVQMVVLKTKEEAEDVKKRVEAGEITIHQAARDYSIDPRAKQTLGDMGWVAKGTGFPELDKLTFSIEPETLGGPVESPAGWHLVMVHDIRDALFEDLVDDATWKTTRRRYMQEKSTCARTSFRW